MPAPPWAAGVLGNGLSFDGINQHVSMGDVSALDVSVGESFSLAFWARTNDNGASLSLPPFVEKDTRTNPRYGYGCRLDQTNRFACSVFSNSITQSIQTAFTVNDNQYRHYVFIRDVPNSQLKLFVDGAIIGNIPLTVTGNLSNAVAFRVGCNLYVTTNDCLVTSVDDVQFYKRPLSDAEVSGLYSRQSLNYIRYNKSARLMEFVTNKGVHAMGYEGPEPTGNSITSGLIGYWKFNETSGATIAANSGSAGAAINGTLTNMDPPNDWVAGKYSNGLDFDGSNDIVNLPDTAHFDLTGAATWCLWFYSRSNQSAVGLFAHGAGSYGWIGAYLTSSSGIIAGYARTAGVAHMVSTPDMGAGYWNNEWHHVCTTFDRTLPDKRLKLYIDGSLAYEVDAQNSNLDASSGPTIGGWLQNATRFNGIIDDVRMYNRALSGDEINTIATLSSCTAPVAPQGRMIYNTDHNVMQYCNGTDWVAIGK